MKLKIDNKYIDVDFWSFMKCNFLTQVVLSVFIYLGLTLMFLIIGLIFA